MTKTRPQFSLYITSILTLLICSCSTWSKSKSNDESRQDSISTYSSTTSINIDSLAATIDTTSYTNTSQKYYEEDVDDDEEDDDYDLDDVYADDGYEDELFPQKTHHATVTYYEDAGWGIKRRYNVDVDVDVQSGRVTRVHFPDNGVYPSGTDLTGGYVENGRTHVTTDYGVGYDIEIH